MHMKNWPGSNLTSALLAFSVILTGCSFFKKKSNERAEGHFQLYSEPNAPEGKSLPAQHRRLILVATSDWQGNLEPQTEAAKDKHQPQEILMSVGGVDIFARYLHILRTHYPDQVMALDAGNSLGGTLDSRSSGATSILEAFSELSYDALSFSAEDLTAGPSLKKGTTATSKWMPPLLAQTKTPVLFTNLVDLQTAQPVAWGNSAPQLLKVVNGVKVGFIGLLSNDSVSKLDAALMNGLYIEHSMQALLKQARLLRLKGAEVIVVSAYGGIECGLKRADDEDLPLNKVNFNPAEAGICSTEGSLASLIQALPAGMVDVIITGGSPAKVANVINGIPVLQAFPKGVAFSRIDLTYDRTNKRVLTDKTVIHQPTRLCHRFFKATEDCFTEDKTVDHRQLIPARYLGEEIKPDAKMSAWHLPWRQKTATENTRLVSVGLRQQHLAKNLRESLGTDLALIDNRAVVSGQTDVSLRDLWKSAALTDQVRLVLVKGLTLPSLRDFTTRMGEQYSWDNLESWRTLTARENVLIAMPQKVWNAGIASWAKANAVTTSSYLAPKLVADTLMPNEADEVTLVESASDRTPPLPDTQP